MKEISDKEKRIRSITQFYYSNPEIQKAILEFSQNREVVPRYFEGFGKRPDILQYPSDILGLVKKGATSFHVSEEIWVNPLEINSDMTRQELDQIRDGWDLLIDIDSPFLDCSKIAADLIIKALEKHGIKNYGLKFSGSKGFHLIISKDAFPEEFDGKKTKSMFPEWPRAISEYLMNYIRGDYNRLASEILTDFKAIENRTKKTKEDLTGMFCKICGRKANLGSLVILTCPVCGTQVSRRDVKITKRRLKCINTDCPGVFEIKEEKKYFFCDFCKDPDNEKLSLSSEKHPNSFEEIKGVSAEEVANLDLVLVASRHLFRMPYSLHEKTALVSTVLEPSELSGFTPKQADPMNVKIKNFRPSNEKDEARSLLSEAIDWKKTQIGQEEREQKINTEKVYREFNANEISEDQFPKPIKKLLQGLSDGKKRGLFVLLTFLRSLNFPPEYIRVKINEWNKKNDPPLKEGYVKSQLDWHLRQRKKILPPNYSNESFYRDLGILPTASKFKNPLAEISWLIRKNKQH